MCMPCILPAAWHNTGLVRTCAAHTHPNAFVHNHVVAHYSPMFTPFLTVPPACDCCASRSVLLWPSLFGNHLFAVVGERERREGALAADDDAGAPRLSDMPTVAANDMMARYPGLSVPGLLRLADYICTASFAVSGSLRAAREGMDPLGCTVVGTIAAVGGGTTRDLLLGKGQPAFWMSDIEYLYVRRPPSCRDGRTSYAMNARLHYTSAVPACHSSNTTRLFEVSSKFVLPFYTHHV